MAVAFQLRDKGNNPISLVDIDEQIGEYFNEPIDPKKWTRVHGWDWYNNLGWCIANKCQGKTSWKRVKRVMTWWTLYGETQKEHRDEAKKLLRETVFPVCDYLESLELTAYGCGYAH